MHDNGDKRYRIALVEEDDLPAEQVFAFLERDDVLLLAVKRTRLTAHVLEDAWTAYREARSA